MFGWIYWDIEPQIFTIPKLNWPIAWYGLFFALGFALSFPLFVSLLTRFFETLSKYKLASKKQVRKEAVLITDQLLIYMAIATVLGARLGHFLFYENPSLYLKNPFILFKVWEGGLASHGGVVGILIGIYLFSKKMRKNHKELTAIRLLDFLTAPAALISFFIRIGNFFNQEILGKPTDLPWAVIFGHPADLSRPYPRHPVQLYEAFFYLFLFFIFWRLTYVEKFLKKQGFLAGLFLVLVFTFRFLIEFLKEEQSRFIPSNFPLTMGQLLSLPVIFLGLFFLFKKKR